MRSNRLLPRVRNALLLFVLLLSAGTMPVNAREAAANQRGSAATTIQQSDSSAFTFTLHTPSAQVANGMVLVPGLETTTNTSGAPQLPYYSTYIALPPGASFELSVSSSSVSSVAVGEIRPAPEHALRKAGTDLFPADALEQRSGYEEAVAYVRDATIYAANAFYPDNNYLLGEEFLAGGFRVVKLDLFPVRYNPLQNRLQQAQEMTVAITFSGAEPVESEAEPSAVQLNAFWRDNMLNQPPASWRSTAQDTMADAPALPIGEDTFKIAVTQDGIQEISGSALAAAGMNIAGVDPATIEMMHRGMPVAYQFLNNDGQPGFGASDAIRFFGWAFNGSRYEDMYVSDNIFWLWADGAAMPIATVANEAGSGYAKVTSFQESLTEWPHVYFFEGWSVDWDESPNEATPWHWNLIAPAAGAAQLRRLSLDLPNPATASAETATVVVEFTTRLNTLKQTSATYDVSVALNKSDAVNATWEDSANVNVELQVPMSELTSAANSKHPINDLSIRVDNTDGAVMVSLYVTRATVEYLRNLIAVDNQLLFSYAQAGKHEFQVSGFNGSSEPVVWDISDPYIPLAITMSPDDVLDQGSERRFDVGLTHGAGTRMIATVEDNVIPLSEQEIEHYVPLDLTPAAAKGSWVAISHESQLPAAQKLADHRAGQSGLSTWVVDVADLYNQFGYGFATPEAIKSFLRYATANWDQPPRYVTLFGDATVNPRNLPCDKCSQGWDAERPTLLPTDLLFVDRFNGLVPVDYTYSLLIGDDIFPDIGVGRITAETIAEANAVVDKIITFEKDFDNFESWHNNIYFVADNADAGGQFCRESVRTGTFVSGPKAFHCLVGEEDAGVPDYEEDYMVPFRAEIFRNINEVGTAVLNYRGHGGITRWANERIMDAEFADAWLNPDKTPVILSADCLDGNFAQTDEEGLGETLLKLSNRGSVAHWSSAGLGFTFEHSVLHESFYEAIFKHRTTALGDIVNYAKIKYLGKGYDTSEAFAFTLLGDPAMELNLRHSLSIPVVSAP